MLTEEKFLFLFKVGSNAGGMMGMGMMNRQMTHKAASGGMDEFDALLDDLEGGDGNQAASSFQKAQSVQQAAA